MYKKESVFGPGRPGKSREVLGRSRDQTGQDLDALKVPWSRGPVVLGLQKSKSSGT